MLWNNVPVRENGYDHLVIAEWFNTIRQAGIDNAGSNTVGKQEIPTGAVNGVNKDFVISLAPTNDDSIIVFINGNALRNDEWSYSAPTITLTNAPVLGQEVYVYYLTEGAPALPVVIDGTQNVVYHTVTAPEVIAKEFALPSVPASASLTIVDMIGGSAQHYGVDFLVSSNILLWDGYTLDGDISEGDVFRVQYLN